MGKKESKQSISDVCNRIVEKCKNKYEEYHMYLSHEFYEKLKTTLPTYYSASSGISADIYLMIVADNLILKELGMLCKNGEIDLEISLIERYSNRLYFIMKKMGHTYEEYQKDGENILIKAIETYDGEKIFENHILNCIRNFGKNENILKTNKNNEKENLIYLEETIADKVKKYLNQNQIEKRTPNYLETLCHHVNIVDIVEDNGVWKEFLYLKYGFYEDIYFTFKEISVILNIDIEEIKRYYHNSLLLLKEITNQYINKINGGDIEFDTSKNYILKY